MFEMAKLLLTRVQQRLLLFLRVVTYRLALDSEHDDLVFRSM